MKPGDRVEVCVAWAHKDGIPLRKWFGGYTVVVIRAGAVVVRDKNGKKSEQKLRDVRPEPEKKS